MRAALYGRSFVRPGRNARSIVGQHALTLRVLNSRLDICRLAPFDDAAISGATSIAGALAFPH